MAITDITDQFSDVNPYDRLYSSESGYTVKVRVEDVSPSPFNLSFSVTGSWADDETGRARSFDAGHFIVEPHELAVRPDTAADLAQIVEDGRRLMVGRVEQAAIHYAARQALSGIKPKQSPAPLPLET